MATYGGDSWVPEAQLRLRRQRCFSLEGIPSHEFKKLSNGKFACLVCRHLPVIDTPQVLMIHRSGSKHSAEADRKKKEERKLRQEDSKRIALNSSSTAYMPRSQLKSRPLEIIRVNSESHQLEPETTEIESTVQPYASKKLKTVNSAAKNGESQSSATDRKNDFIGPEIGPIKEKPTYKSCPWLHLSEDEEIRMNPQPLTRYLNGGAKLQPEKLEVNLQRREEVKKEIRLRESGWIRDANGGWFRDPNVEFETDEESPN